MKTLVIFLGRLLFLLKRKSPPRNPKKICLLKIGAIGDVLMSTPLVKQLRRAYPNAEILYIVGEWSRVSLQGNPNIDRVVAFDEAIIWKFKLRKLFGFLRRLRRDQIDLGFVLDKHYSAPLFAALSGIRYRIGFDRRGEGFANNRNVPYGPVRHEVEYNLDLLRSLGGAIGGNDATDIEVFVSQSDRDVVDAVLRQHQRRNVRLIGIAPGGAQNPNQIAHLKRWPLRHYIELIRMILERDPDVCVVLFGGKTDRGIHTAIQQQFLLTPRIVDCAGVLNVQQTVECMRRCVVIVTHDSGPMHMAAASGAPVISLSGPVNPGRTAPIGARHTNILKAEVEGALCYDDEGKFPATTQELPCMAQILPEEVYASMKRYGVYEII